MEETKNNLGLINKEDIIHNNLLKEHEYKDIEKEKNIKTIYDKFGRFSRENIKIFQKLVTIFCMIILLVVIYQRKKSIYKRNKNSLDQEKIIHKQEKKISHKDDNFEYYACFSGMGKKENKYVRELIEYYLKLGVGKFILGDNNDLNTEKLSDVIQDYIDKGSHRHGSGV